ncbi:MAG: ABC transporter permease [Planctomycetota bacterium]
MKVDQAAFRRWDGVLKPGVSAVPAIAGTTIRRVFRRAWIRRLIFVVVLINISIAAILTYIVTQRVIGDQSIQELARERGFGDIDPFALALRGFLGQLWFFTPVIAALTAGPLIAEDRRAKALPLYFSRPIRHWHYMVGKLAAGGFFLVLVTMLPPLAMFGVEITNSPEEGIFMARLYALLHAWLACFALTAALTSISLGISSLMDRTNTASLAVFGVLVIASIAARICANVVFDNNAWLAINPFLAMQRVAHELLPIVPKAIVNMGGLENISKTIPLAAAWQSLVAWTGTGLLLFGWRVRNVEVVT